MHLDEAAALLDDAVNRGESQPGALALLFGSEERLEDAGARLGIHAGSGVADIEANVWASHRSLRQRAMLKRDIGGADDELAAAGHGIARVDRQVHDDLLGLAGIGLGAAQRGIEIANQIHVFADQAAQELLHVCDHGVHVQNFGSEYLLAAEGQQLPGESGGAIGGPLHFFHLGAHRVGGLDLIEH